MTNTLPQQIEELQNKVNALIAALQTTRTVNAELLAENKQLKTKVTSAQTQIDQMINQWFPELELNTGDNHADH